MNIGEYAKYFHNQKTISYFGSNIKRLYIYNDMPFLKDVWPLNCVIHGELTLEQIQYARSEELIAPPPDPQVILSKFVKDQSIEKLKKQIKELETAKNMRNNYPENNAIIGLLGRIKEINDINFKNIDNEEIILKRRFADGGNKDQEINILESYNHLIKLRKQNLKQ